MPDRKRSSTVRGGEARARVNRAVSREGRSGRRGFAAMDEERQRAIASAGGRAAHRRGTAHQWSPEEARRAGKKGGRAAHERGTAHQWDEDEARRAGRKGGRVAHARGTAHEWDKSEARRAGKKGGRARWSEEEERSARGQRDAKTNVRAGSRQKR